MSGNLRANIRQDLKSVEKKSDDFMLDQRQKQKLDFNIIEQQLGPNIQVLDEEFSNFEQNTHNGSVLNLVNNSTTKMGKVVDDLMTNLISNRVFSFKEGHTVDTGDTTDLIHDSSILQNDHKSAHDTFNKKHTDISQQDFLSLHLNSKKSWVIVWGVSIASILGFKYYIMNKK